MDLSNIKVIVADDDVFDEEAGFKLIERMKKAGIYIPVIVCSSLNYSIPNILGNVWYNKLNDLSSFHKLEFMHFCTHTTDTYFWKYVRHKRF